MPTNLPDQRKREAQASEERLANAMIAIMAVGMVIACALVVGSLAVAG
jgi:hypothetical protein